MRKDGEAGEIYRLAPEDIGEPAQPIISAHHLNLLTAIKLGKRLFPKKMPGAVIVFAVGIQEVTEFTEEMTGKVKEAIPKAINLILEEVDSNKKSRFHPAFSLNGGP